MIEREKRQNLFDRLRYHSWFLVLLWTGCIGVSLLWNLYEQREKILKIARNSAQITFENDVLYRRWAAKQGGVYVPVSKDTPPNPYLNVPNRDVTTSSGLSLTLVNPAYMARQVNQMAADIHGSQGHITSLNPIRPENTPDSWETAALKSFEKGIKEVSSVEEIADEEYMRLMRPFAAEKSCLKCHASQGYKEGDIRGGISVSIPMRPLWAIEKPHITRLSLAHLLLWIVGIAVIVISKKGLEKQILARERAEAVLRESANTLRIVADFTYDWEYWRSPDDRFLYVSPSCERITGYTREEFMQDPGLHSRIIHPDDRERVVAHLSEDQSHPELCELEFRIVRRDGQERWIGHACQPVLETHGQLLGRRASNRDITERKCAEQAILRAKEEWERTFNTVPDLLAILDNHHRLVRVNKAMADRLGLTPEQCIGRTCYESVHGLPHPPDFCPHVLTCQDAKEHVTEVHEPHLGGDFLVSTTPLLDERGQLIGSVHVARDITERKRAEESLRQRTLELQQLAETLEQRVQERTEELAMANERLRNQIDEYERVEVELKKSESSLRQLSSELLNAQEKERKMIAGEIHDSIGSSLAAIKFKVETTLTELTGNRPKTPTALKSLIPIVQGAIDEARRIQMNLRPSMLDDLGILPTIKWLCRQFESTYSDIRIKQSIKIEEHEVPDSLKTAIFRVLQEGLNNVAKHSRAKGVSLFLRKTDHGIQLVIRDYGQGFDLSRVQSPDGITQGLGLKSMRERTELSGGSFNIQSIEGKGTIVRASWPLRENGFYL
jgi:PAS domain S-box-containing protein